MQNRNISIDITNQINLMKSATTMRQTRFPSTTKSRKNRTMSALLLLVALLPSTDGFAMQGGANRALLSSKAHREQRFRRTRMVSVSMFLDDIDTSTLPALDILSSHSSEPSSTKVDNELSSSNLLSNSLFEAELLNGLAHVTLDFASLWGGAALALRLAAVFGRICVVASDFVPDKEILPDELAFQLGLLFIAFNGLIRSALPKIKASLAPPLMSSQDRQAFRALFRPAGISWHQYRELSLSSMDWLTVEAGTIITSEETSSDQGDSDSVYWLYQGDVEIHSNEKFLHNISRGGSASVQDKTDRAVAGLGLFGEMRLAKLFDGHRGGKTKHRNAAQGVKNSDNSHYKYTVVAGERGATLLRMNTTKLHKLIRHDQELSQSINRLVFKGMQDKLNALLLKT